MAKSKNESVVGKPMLPLTGETLRDRIYLIRGQKVMLDCDLAEIYGYTTSAFNQQVVRNMERFDGDDFMFRLTEDDLSTSRKIISISQNVISMQTKGVKGGRTKMPYVFTEQGVYMLMTVLRGPLAVRQSRTLVRLFKVMKDYIVENQMMLEHREDLQIVKEVMKNAHEALENRKELDRLDKEIKRLESSIYKMSSKLNNVVMRSEISPIMLDINKLVEQKEFLFLDGEPIKASELYVSLYSRAKKSIYVIDNYASIKTLKHLLTVGPGTEIIIFTDNVGKYLQANDIVDFKKERKDVKVNLIRTEGRIHDRFVILDYGEKDEEVYHFGASEKDAGRKITMVNKLGGGVIRALMDDVVEGLKGNEELWLK